MKIHLILLSLCFMCLHIFSSCSQVGTGNLLSTSSDTPAQVTVGDLSTQDSTINGQATVQPKHGSVASEIHASFSDEIKAPGKNLEFEQPMLNKVHVPAELSETVEELVLTMVGNAMESEVTTNNTEERYIVRAQPRVPGQQPTTEDEEGAGEVTEPPTENVTDSSPQPPLPAADDIPSFSEWTQQQLAERRRADPNVTERVRSTKVRIKNYASPDCGAKIVSANPEAISAASVLSSSRDEYMLNHCTSRVWFIIELCEAVQAKQLDLANFELFSSSPKEFSVFIGTRFPSRDWQSVGRFTAEDSRNIQTFDLNPQLFGKYLKVELHSHYGKEHYCPLSLVRVYGTSEYEVLATEDERHTDDDDDLAEEEAGTAPRNLFTSATDAVLSIVKKATAPFLKSELRSETARVTPSHCVSPRYLIVCDNCSEHTYDNLFYLLSCQQESVYNLVNFPFIRNTLIRTETCSRFGLEFSNLREGAPFPLGRPLSKENYITALLKEPYVAALCNALAVIENRVVVNTSVAAGSSRNQTDEPIYSPPSPSVVTLLPPTLTCVAPDYSTTSTHTTKSNDYTHTIKPTKTLREEDVKKLPYPKEEPISIEHTDTLGDPLPTTVVTPSATLASSTSKESMPPIREETSETLPINGKSVDEGREKDIVETPRDASLDAILHDLSELVKEDIDRELPSATPPPSPPKDSIFLRLANRIKNLELNMSLSSSYLEELSRRYRQQQETLGQNVNSTVTKLDEFVRSDEHRTKKRDEEIAALRVQVATLSKEIAILLHEKNSWLPKFSHIFWFIIEIFVIWYVMTKWSRPHLNIENSPPNIVKLAQRNKPKRRNSVEAIPGHVIPERALERRPSDEALEITISNCYRAVERKRKKRKKDNSRKSSVTIKRKKSEASNSSEERCKELVPSLRQSSEPPMAVSSYEDLPIIAADVVTTNRFAAFESPRVAPPDHCSKSNDMIKPQPRLVRRFSSPAFMRTAISSRAARTSTSEPPSDPSPRLKKESGFKKYMKKLF